MAGQHLPPRRTFLKVQTVKAGHPQAAIVQENDCSLRMARPMST